MKVFKMNKLEILKFEIKNKINFIESHILKFQKNDSEVINKIPDYLNAISRLEKKNAELKAEQKIMSEEHSKDLERVEGLVKEVSKLMEGNDG
jgi:hypothetical protein